MAKKLKKAKTPAQKAAAKRNIKKAQEARDKAIVSLAEKMKLGKTGDLITAAKSLPGAKVVTGKRADALLNKYNAAVSSGKAKKLF